MSRFLLHLFIHKSSILNSFTFSGILFWFWLIAKYGNSVKLFQFQCILEVLCTCNARRKRAREVGEAFSMVFDPLHSIQTSWFERSCGDGCSILIVDWSLPKELLSALGSGTASSREREKQSTCPKIWEGRMFLIVACAYFLLFLPWR